MEPIVKKVWTDEQSVFIQTSDGKIYAQRFADYPLLRKATASQRARFEYDNFGIRWENIDEDLSYQGFMKSPQHSKF
jgi:hypothetical protein